MAHYSYEQAIQALKNRVGSRWEGADTDGRGEMARALQDELGISRGVADDLIDALVESGQIRYVREQALGGAVGGVIPAAPASSMGGAPIGGGTGGTPGVPAVPIVAAPGHWQIGADDGAGGAAERIAREGQVDPTA